MSDPLCQGVKYIIPQPRKEALLVEALEHTRWRLVACGGCGRQYKRCVLCNTGVQVDDQTRPVDQCGGHKNEPCASTCLIRVALESERGEVVTACPCPQCGWKGQP